ALHIGPRSLDPRSRQCSVVNLFLPGHNLLKTGTGITETGNAVSDKHRQCAGTDIGKMDVRIPETWHDILAGPVNHAHASGYRDGSLLANAENVPTRGNDRLVRR